MRYREINETNYTDMMPKSFEDFRRRYLKLSKAGQTRNLYVQFTHNGSNMDRTAFLNPDHSDPVGIYGYPMDYVLKYPADVWYGRGARYLRVLEDTSSSKLFIDAIDDEWEAKRILRRMGWDVPQIDEMFWRAKKLFKGRYGTVNVWAKIFLSCVQMDLLSFDMESVKDDTRNRPDVRSGVEQTALFRKAGFDTIEDTSKNNKRAIINDREPEQIIFLTRGAFRIREVIPLRPGIRDRDTPSMTTSDPSARIIQRPFAQKVAVIMGDKLREGPERTGLGGRSFYWTVKGRRIEIDFPMNPSYYDNKKMGEKPHRQHKLADEHQAVVAVKTEIGEMKTSGDQTTPWQELLDDLTIDWKELQAAPQETDWEPETKALYHEKAEKARKDAAWARIQKENEQLLQYVPTLTESVTWAADHYGLPFDGNLQSDDADFWMALRALERLKVRREFTPEQVLGFGDDDFSAPRLEKFKPMWDQLRPIIERIFAEVLPDKDKGWQIANAGMHVFEYARQIIENKKLAA